MSEDIVEFPNLNVILVEPESPGNVGFTARVMANFGVEKMRIVGTDMREEDEARIFSVHAIAILENAEIHSTLEEALNGIKASWAATARVGGNHSVTRAVVPLPELCNPRNLNGEVALVFGRESNGLTNEEISLCDLSFTIPVAHKYTSLNLSHAVGVVLYHFFANHSGNNLDERTTARLSLPDEREQAAIFFDELVDWTTIKDFRKPIVKQVFRNLLGKAYMTGREMTTLIGTIRKIKEMVENSGTNHAYP